MKLGYDLKLGDAGYVTPYGSVSGLFQSGDDYKLSNDMKVDGQSYDSMRYELGVDAGYTFAYSEDQALTPYFKLAYVYDDSNNDSDVNGDSIDNGVEGSAVRVGLGTQFSFTKNFSAYTDANYLGGGDVDQDWSANVGVKYTVRHLSLLKKDNLTQKNARHGFDGHLLQGMLRCCLQINRLWNLVSLINVCRNMANTLSVITIKK